MLRVPVSRRHRSNRVGHENARFLQDGRWSGFVFGARVLELAWHMVALGGMVINLGSCGEERFDMPM
jgi:hypothetical protein